MKLHKYNAILYYEYLFSKFNVIILLIFLFSCAPYEDEKWATSLPPVPRFEKYYNAGIYGINKKYITQYCDKHCNAKWLRYNSDTKIWKQFRYTTKGCIETTSKPNN